MTLYFVVIAMKDKVLTKQSVLLKEKDCHAASQLAMTDRTKRKDCHVALQLKNDDTLYLSL
jgi:hypothetical protein